MWQLKKLLNTRIIFCANQISLTLANQLLIDRDQKDNLIIFYDSLRCEPQVFSNKSKSFYKVTRLTLLKIYLVSIFFRPVEVVVPHFKWGAARVFAKIGNRVSLIDDGLDTFRINPNNIDLSLIGSNTNYYTFKYDLELPHWLINFRVVKLCPLKKISQSYRGSFDFNQYDVVFIESPGLTESVINDQCSACVNKSILVKHSNPNKSNITKFCGDVIAGAEVALEASLTNYSGEIFVGESMVAVYLMTIKNPSFKVTLCININNTNNLSSLLEIGFSLNYVNVIKTK